MDIHRFDVMTRSLTAGSSRRGIVVALGGSLLALPSLMTVSEAVIARKKGKKNKKDDKDKKNKKSVPEPTAPLCASPLPPPEQAQPQLAGGCETTPFGSTGGGADSRSAQTFTASRSGALQQIRVAISKEAGSSGDFVVQLVLASANGPAHDARSVIAASTIANADVPGGDSTLVANFAGTPIQTGQTYAVAVTRLNGGIVNVQVGNGSSCPNSTWFLAFGNNEFIAPGANVDMIFSVFVV